MQHIDKLEKTVNDGDYYGAQQMYKSLVQVDDPQ
ncbi:hypothetical protein CK203_111203 [Vitis vinifera]|uniref:Uncharacterized protein n=1 Tax=Vitis vinifera TaxID=29760 RepID=A0A438CGR7_VITVI|nr:hypothetical protein CK203_111203 [Vitis vinifera]